MEVMPESLEERSEALAEERDPGRLIYGAVVPYGQVEFWCAVAEEMGVTGFCERQRVFGEQSKNHDDQGAKGYGYSAGIPYNQGHKRWCEEVKRLRGYDCPPDGLPGVLGKRGVGPSRDKYLSTIKLEFEPPGSGP